MSTLRITAKRERELREWIRGSPEAESLSDTQAAIATSDALDDRALLLELLANETEGHRSDEIRAILREAGRVDG